MRTETLSIVFTDLKGYTATTSAQSHKENAKLLKRVERLVAPVFKAFNGRVVKSIGDAYMVVFRSPTEAVQCATAVQDRIHQHNVDRHNERAIHLRIAMNVGEVRVHRGDVFGEPVNIAARLESITPAGEVYMSEAVYLTMNRSDLPAEKVGVYELKGIPEPVTVFRVLPVQAQSDEQDDTGGTSLPYGGKHLEYWKRQRWVRPAYGLMWALAASSLVLATALRYQPTDSYLSVVSEVKALVDQDQATDALAKAHLIPATASQERAMVRPYRLQAIRKLIERGDLAAAQTEVDSLLADNDRDAESLLLRGVLEEKAGHLPDAVATVEQALKSSGSLAQRRELIELAVRAYAHPKARKEADRIVAKYIKLDAVDVLGRALDDKLGDRVSHNYMAARLEKLGAGDEVDWVELAIGDLRATNCKQRRSAIDRLITAHDTRAVGPLQKLVEQKTCGSKEAAYAAERILKP